FCRIFANARVVACRPAVIDPHVASVDPSRLLQLLQECCNAALPDQIIRGKWDVHANAPHALWLLRTRTKRPRSRCAPEERDEFAAGHSMTSSARASSVGGSVRPSSLAVGRLMTSSNFDACITGRSAGLAPLRMRAA